MNDYKEMEEAAKAYTESLEQTYFSKHELELMNRAFQNGWLKREQKALREEISKL